MTDNTSSGAALLHPAAEAQTRKLTHILKTSSLLHLLNNPDTPTRRSPFLRNAIVLAAFVTFLLNKLAASASCMVETAAVLAIHTRRARTASAFPNAEQVQVRAHSCPHAPISLCSVLLELNDAAREANECLWSALAFGTHRCSSREDRAP